MENNMNKVELMDEELDMINGGNIWDDIKSFGNDVYKSAKELVNTAVEKTVETVNEVVDTVVDAVKNRDNYTTPTVPQYFDKPVKPIIM